MPRRNRVKARKQRRKAPPTELPKKARMRLWLGLIEDLPFTQRSLAAAAGVEESLIESLRKMAIRELFNQVGIQTVPGSTVGAETPTLSCNNLEGSEGGIVQAARAPTASSK